MVIDTTMYVFLALIVAFLMTCSATPIVMMLAPKIGAIDIPKDERRVHNKPIPRIGGLAIFYGFIVSVMCFGVIDLQMTGILVGAVIIVTVGIIDDIRPVKAIYKLFFQILAASIVVALGVRIGFIQNPFHIWFAGMDKLIDFGWISIPITVIWIVGLTNAINLIDGLDGLAVGVSSIVSICMLALMLVFKQYNLAIITAAVAGAGFGFLPYNFNPAKIFMGDTGSTFLGFILACISVQGVFKVYTVISIAVPILILGLPIFDTMFAIIRRLLKGQSPMSPDRGHLHHRLLDVGLNQKQTVIILYAITAMLCLSGFVMSFRPKRVIVLIAAVAVLIVSGARYMRAIRNNNENSNEKENLNNEQN